MAFRIGASMLASSDELQQRVRSPKNGGRSLIPYGPMAVRLRKVDGENPNQGMTHMLNSDHRNDQAPCSCTVTPLSGHFPVAKTHKPHPVALGKRVQSL